MYELKKNGKVFMSKFVGTGPALVLWKKNLPGCGLTKVEKHCFRSIAVLVFKETVQEERPALPLHQLSTYFLDVCYYGYCPCNRPPKKGIFT